MIWKVIIRTNLISGMKSMFIFSVERIKKGREKLDDHKTCPVNINKDSNQTLQLIQMQT